MRAFKLSAAVQVLLTSFAGPIYPYASSGKIVIEGRPTVVYLDPRVATTIRLSEPVNSLVLGDPTLFHVEHSADEPLLAFVRALSPTPAESNLVISTVKGR